MDDSGEALELSHVSKSFHGKSGNILAVDDVNLRIQSGSIVALLGPNGAGKTTLLDMILGLTLPQSGTVSVYGTSPHEAIKAQKIGAVLQTGGLLEDISVEHIIKMVAATLTSPLSSSEVLSRAGIAHLASRKISKCSGGEKQRVRFALALLSRPQLLILDEPTAGMDVSSRHEFWDAMRSQADRGTTIIFATHYLEEAQNFAQRIVLMSSGRIIADGTVDDIRSVTGSKKVSFTLEEAPTALLEQWNAKAEPSSPARYTVVTPNSEEFVLELLSKTAASDLEILKPTLDDAFLQLVERR